MVLADRLVCGFSALRAEKPHTIEKDSTALPKAQCANCVSPIYDEPYGLAHPPYLAVMLTAAVIFQRSRGSSLSGVTVTV